MGGPREADLLYRAGQLCNRLRAVVQRHGLVRDISQHGGGSAGWEWGKVVLLVNEKSGAWLTVIESVLLADETAGLLRSEATHSPINRPIGIAARISQLTGNPGS